MQQCTIINLPIHFTIQEDDPWTPAFTSPLELIESFETGSLKIFRHDHYTHFSYSIIKPAAILLPAGRMVYDFILKKHGENPVCFVKNT